MKRFMIIAAIILSGFYCSAQWVQVAYYASIGGVYCFVNSGTRIIAATAAIMVQSTNNGDSWEKKYDPSNIKCFAASNNTIYAGTGFGMYKSTNNGTSWLWLEGTLVGNKTITSVMIDGSNIFAGTYYDGIFLSTNEGASWVNKSNGLDNGVVKQFIKKGNYIFCNTLYGIHYSTNNGDNWEKRNTGITDISTSLAITENNIYASTLDSGVFVSTNNGGNWLSSNNGLTYKDCNTMISYGNNLFVGLRNEHGIFMSTDAGENWADVSNGLVKKKVKSLFIYNGLMFAGIDYDCYIYRRPLIEMLAVNELDNELNLQIYPNPTAGKLRIKLNELACLTDASFTIYNNKGQIEFHERLLNYNHTIDLSGKASGVYFLKISTKNGSIIKKFIKE